MTTDPEKTFPLMLSYWDRRTLTNGGFEHLPTTVPWALVQEARVRLEGNHGGQTLDRLAQRGGLSPAELVVGLLGWNGGDKRACVLYGQPLTSWTRLTTLLRDFESRSS